MNDNVLSGVCVLVVEDEYLIALEAQRMAEEAGAEQVLLANSIADVQKLLADGPRLDVVVLDIKLGKEDATPLIAEFAKRNVPFLVATGFDGGAPDGIRCITKPYHETELIEAILRLIRRE